MLNRRLLIVFLSLALSAIGVCSLAILSLSYPSISFSGYVVRTPNATRTSTPTGIPTSTSSHYSQADLELTATAHAFAFADVQYVNRALGISLQVMSYNYYGYNGGETIVIYNRRSGTTRLAGLSLIDEDGYEIALPNIVIAPHGSAAVYMGYGENSARDIYLGVGDDVWQPGEQVTLRGRDGTIYAIGRVSVMSLTTT